MVSVNKTKPYPKEECGIVGVYNIPEAATIAYLGTYALQHRGQESAGIVSLHENHLYRYAGMGKVIDVFTQSKLSQLKGKIAIAHNRYSTTGASFLRNAQPIRMESRLGSMALAHNGNLTNSWKLRQQLENKGTIFQTTVDTEVICHLMAKLGRETLQSALIEALSMVKGAYSLLALTKEALYATRDPHGFRPLILGKKGEGWILASETCALDIVDAEYVRDVQPGEFIAIDDQGLRSFFPFKKRKESMCIFEFVYFSRPDSNIFNQSVYDVRIRLGRVLAQESPVDADVVIPVPDSSNVSAIGYSMESGIPFHTGLIRSHYVGRTFIEPDRKIRDFGAKLKYNSIPTVVKDKRIIVVDDSIMRGTTSKKIVSMLRKRGAKEIHFRISSSPTTHPCYYGIDIPSKEELIASKHSIEDIKDYLGVNSLAYLSNEGMLKSVNAGKGFCMACFNGKYPVPLSSDMQNNYSNQKELFEEFKVEER